MAEPRYTTVPSPAARAMIEESHAVAVAEQGREQLSCNALRRPGVSIFREVVETEQVDDVVRVERLSCGHTKTTMTASQRPAQRRRCLKCEQDVAS